MREPPAPPPGKSKKHRQQLIIAGVALAALLVLYLRSRSSSSGSSSQTAQQAAAQAAAQQAQLDQAAQGAAGGGVAGQSAVTPSTFADNGSQAAALGDAVTSGLSGVQSALQSIQQPGTGAGGAGLPTDPNAGLPVDPNAGGLVAPTAPAPPPTTITINNTPPGQPAGSPTRAPARAAPAPVKLPPPPAGGGHYVEVAGKPELIHAVGKNEWAPGPPPKPPLKAKAPNANKKK